MSVQTLDKWAKVAIGEVAEIVAGGTPSSKDATCFASPGTAIAWLTPADLSGYKKHTIKYGARDLTEKGFASCSAKLMPAGSVLFSSRAPIGYVAIADGSISTNQGFKSFVFLEPINNRFAYYQLRYLVPEAEARATGTTFKELSGTAAAKLPFWVAPEVEQLRIADKLDTILTRVDALNDRLARVTPLLKRFRQSVLAAATSGRLTEDWRIQKTPDPIEKDWLISVRKLAASSNKERKIIDDLVVYASGAHPECSFPSSWLRTCIGMGGVVSNGSTPSRGMLDYWGGLIPWVSSGEVRNNRIDVTKESISELGFESSSVRKLPVGTVLIAMIGEGKTRGQSAILNIEATINQNIAAVVPVAEILNPTYLWYWFQGQYENNRKAGNGTGPQALNCQKVRELPLNLPSLGEQAEIVSRIEALFAYADRLEARLQTARTAADRLTPALLAKAFRGELVPQDPNDEPATELLRRLREARVNEASQSSKPALRKKIESDIAAK